MRLEVIATIQIMVRVGMSFTITYGPVNSGRVYKYSIWSADFQVNSAQLSLSHLIPTAIFVQDASQYHFFLRYFHDPRVRVASLCQHKG